LPDLLHKYLRKVAKKFCVGDVKPVYIPMDPGLVLTDDDGSKLMSAPFQAACGSILWAAIISRPDAQFSVGVLAQHNLTPSKTHWKALKRVIWYLDTTRDLWLTFGRTDDLIRGFTD
jgi:hypothetical protein